MNSRFAEVEADVLSIFKSENNFVAFDREIRYRLETKYAHDEVGEAIKRLKNKALIKPTSLPGRKGSGDRPNQFYRLPDSDYKAQMSVMRKKLDLSNFITRMSSDMGGYAQMMWWRVFNRNGWIMLPDQEAVGGIRSFKGKTSTINNDLDFLAERDNVVYGVEVKNGLNYPDDLYFKFLVAAELNTIPYCILLRRQEDEDR